MGKVGNFSAVVTYQCVDQADCGFSDVRLSIPVQPANCELGLLPSKVADAIAKSMRVASGYSEGERREAARVSEKLEKEIFRLRTELDEMYARSKAPESPKAEAPQPMQSAATTEPKRRGRPRKSDG